MGGIVKIMDNGNNIKGDLITYVLTSTYTGTKLGINILSTSVANPSIPGSFKIRDGTLRSSRYLLPCVARDKVGVVDVGVVLTSRGSPII